MTNAFFHNFTTEAFTGFWNGKPKTFKPGDRVLMPAWLAEHFAKHLTNRELIKANKEVYTSPKNPGQVPEFMNLFKKCYIPENRPAGAKDEEEIDSLIASAAVPSMDITVEKPKPIQTDSAAAALAAETAQAPQQELEIDQFDAHAHQNFGPGGEATVIKGPDAEDDDESGFEHAEGKE